MSSVTQRPRPTAPTTDARAAGPTPADGPARPLAVSTALAALAIAGAGLVLAVGLVVIGWLAGHDGSIGGATRVGATVWLAGHGGAPRIGDVRLGLLPLGVPVLVLLAARRGGRWALDSSAAAGDLPAAGAAAAAGGVYGLVAAGLALVAVPDGAAVDPVRAGVVAGLLMAAGVAAGLAPGPDWVARATRRLPALVAVAVRGAVAGLLAVLGLSALVLLATLVVQGSDVVALGARLAPGLVGGSLLVVAGLLVLPNALLWTASYLLGPGFAVGSGTAVSPTGVTLGTLPAYPPLAALPAPGEQPAWASMLLVLPVAAGVVAGVVAERRAATGRWWETAATGALAGALAGVALAGLLLVSGGAIGPGRLAEAGPLSPAALLAVGSLGLGGLVGGLGTRALADRAGLAERLPQLPRLPRLPRWGRMPRLPWRHR